MAEHVEYMENLPHEVLVKILSFLDIGDLVKTVPHVCQRWKDASQDILLWCDRTFSPHPYMVEEEIVWYLKNMPRLRHFKLCYYLEKSIKDIDVIIKTLSDVCPHTETLAVDSRFYFSDEIILQFIKRSTELTTLEMAIGRRNDDYLIVNAIRDAPNIKHLSVEMRIHDSNMDIESLQELVRSSTSLQTLHFATHIECMEDLVAIVQVTKHVLTGMSLILDIGVDSDIVETFKKMVVAVPSLQTLHLTVSVRDATHLPDLIQVVRHVLTRLCLYCRTGECMGSADFILKCYRLERLEIVGGELPYIAQLPRLSVLSLIKTVIPVDVVSNLSSSNTWLQLENLQLWSIHNIDDATWRQMFRSTPNLRRVDLKDCRITPDCISSLAEYCVRVRVLILSRTNVETSMFERLGKLAYLERVSMDRCYNLTRLVVQNIVKCVTLKCLNLDRNHWLDDSAVIDILTHLKLEVLSMVHSGAQGSFLTIAEKCKNVKSLYVCDCVDSVYRSAGEALEHVRIYVTSPCLSSKR